MWAPSVPEGLPAMEGTMLEPFMENCILWEGLTWNSWRTVSYGRDPHWGRGWVRSPPTGKDTADTAGCFKFGDNFPLSYPDLIWTKLNQFPWSETVLPMMVTAEWYLSALILTPELFCYILSRLSIEGTDRASWATLGTSVEWVFGHYYRRVYTFLKFYLKTKHALILRRGFDLWWRDYVGTTLLALKSQSSWCRVIFAITWRMSC